MSGEPPAALAALLRDRRLLLVTGKGGVGKSTVASALAFAAARQGRRTLLAEVGARPAMAAVFGRGPAPGDDPGDVGEGVDGVLLDHDSCLRAYLKEHLERAQLTRAVLSHPIAVTFLRAAPSVTEVTTLNRVVSLASSGVYDTVIVDMPAFGHAYQMLRAPRTIASMVRGGVVTGPSERIARALADAGRTALVAVSLPEELPVSETIEHAALLRRDVGASVQAVVLNQAVAPLAATDVVAAVVRLRNGEGRPDGAIGQALDLAGIRIQAARSTRDLAGRLREAIGVPVVLAPLIAEGLGARELVGRVEGALFPVDRAASWGADGWPGDQDAVDATAPAPSGAPVSATESA